MGGRERGREGGREGGKKKFYFLVGRTLSLRLSTVSMHNNTLCSPAAAAGVRKRGGREGGREEGGEGRNEQFILAKTNSKYHSSSLPSLLCSDCHSAAVAAVAVAAKDRPRRRPKRFRPSFKHSRGCKPSTHGHDDESYRRKVCW